MSLQCWGTMVPQAPSSLKEERRPPDGWGGPPARQRMMGVAPREPSQGTPQSLKGHTWWSLTSALMVTHFVDENTKVRSREESPGLGPRLPWRPLDQRRNIHDVPIHERSYSRFWSLKIPQQISKLNFHLPHPRVPGMQLLEPLLLPPGDHRKQAL